jgi:SAM-dependent methyltransferase/glycosyltransferase involved in cell wall biosynthesis
MGLPFTAETIPSGEPLGGSETAAIQAAHALANLGHRVTLFCNTEQHHASGRVIYAPFGWVAGAGGPDAPKFPKGFFDYARATPTDVMLVQRQPGIFQFEFPSKCNVLWQHDLATKQGPSAFGPVVWNLDRIWVLSEFMKRQYQGVHGGSDALYHVTRNGIDLAMIDNVVAQERDRFKVMFTARPERGLDILLTMAWPEILKREPRAKLYLSRYQDPTTLPLYTELTQLAKQFGDSVIDLGHLGKQELYKHYKQARLFLYSSVFEEISHITSMEVAGNGAVMIGPWKGACPETCAGTQVLIRDDGTIGVAGDPLDQGLQAVTPAFIKTFVEQTINLIHDDERWTRLSQAGRARAEQWQWEPVAEDWTQQFHEIIAQKTSNPKRMIKHFLVKSDVVAAEKYAAARPQSPELAKAVQNYIDRFVPFMRVTDPEMRRQALASFYEQRSGGAHADYRVAFWADNEPRCKVLIDWLRKHPEVKSMMDFGCAHGGYTRAVSNALPTPFTVLGVDISPALIRCCQELQVATMPDGTPACQRPESIQFIVGDEDMPVSQELDCVVCMDTIEHLPDAEQVMAKLERYCKPGGWMIFTVPTGNRERSEFLIKNIAPVHVRSFDQHDILELFGHRQNFHAMSFSDLSEAELDRTFSGWYMVAYQRDDKPVGTIDYERKFLLQGPRETLAVCMITNNSEDVLHRSLRSVQKIADQIVVLDNGPSVDRSVALALEYTEDVRAGTSPFFCYTHLMAHDPMQIEPGTCQMAGFETPRNESIENIWADWILWIDSDEHLLEWNNLWKYLRANCLLGYAMQQHHIAVDPPGILKRDIPVRLFRNHADIKFYGVVHEHAETGINKGVGPACLIVPDSHIAHDGYLTEPIRRRRFWRNFRLLQCDRLKYPERTLGRFLYDIRDNMHLAKYGMEQTGGRITPEIRQNIEGCTTAFRDFFLKSDYAFLTEDALNYYSEALAILGQGVEVAVSLDIKHVGATPNGVSRFRAVNQAEAKVIMEKLLSSKFAPFEGPYVR